MLHTLLFCWLRQELLVVNIIKITSDILQVPAELFPTRFRCTCHGISAASGKLGSILAQCFLGYVDFGNGANWRHVPDWLGYALLW